VQINASPDWLLWHHWPDARLHDLSVPGHGLAALAREASEKLGSDAFWTLGACALGNQIGARSFVLT
jgi:hypothetical protein